MTRRLKVLLIDDDEDEFILTQDLLADRSYISQGQEEVRFELDWVPSYADALRAFEKDEYDVYLVDYLLGSHDGLELLREPVVKRSGAPIILMTGQGSYTVDVEAMKAGATDYLVKSDVTAVLLERTIRYAIDRKRAERELIATANEIARLYAAEARRARELDALHRATTALLSTIDLDALLGYILDAAQSAVPAAEKGMLHLVAPDTGQLQIRATSGFSDPRIVKFSMMKGQDFTAKAARERRPLLIRDALDRTDVPEPMKAEREGDISVLRSVIVAPLILNDRVLGVLSLSAFRPAAFTEADLRLLESFAATTTAALHNAMLHAEVQKLALTDPLTEVYNRRGLFEFGQREIERAHRFGRPLSVILVDVDHLKLINDTYGHAAGDQVLRIVADRFRTSIREVDILGRYGGDEFVILLPETDLFTACSVAERIRQRVTEPIRLPLMEDPGDPVVLTASLGVANALSDTPGLEQLIKRADSAAYQAKSKGRNRVEVG